VNRSGSGAAGNSLAAAYQYQDAISKCSNLTLENGEQGPASNTGHQILQNMHR
jgi:hypothetical protein